MSAEDVQAHCQAHDPHDDSCSRCRAADRQDAGGLVVRAATDEERAAVGLPPKGEQG